MVHQQSNRISMVYEVPGISEPLFLIIWSNEVVATIRKRGIPTIAGSCDSGIGRVSGDCAYTCKEEPEKANGKVSIACTSATVSEQGRAYLRTLPTNIQAAFELGYNLGPLWKQHPPFRCYCFMAAPDA